MARHGRYGDSDPDTTPAEPEAELAAELPAPVDPEQAAREAHRDKVVGDLQAKQQAIDAQTKQLEAQRADLDKQIEAARQAAEAPPA